MALSLVGWSRSGSRQISLYVRDEGPGLANTANLFVPFLRPNREGPASASCSAVRSLKPMAERLFFTIAKALQDVKLCSHYPCRSDFPPIMRKCGANPYCCSSAPPSSSLAQRDVKRERPVRQSVRGLQARLLPRVAIMLLKPACASFTKAETPSMAGLAAMFAASVAEFSHFGFGGEAPILIRTKDGRVISIPGVGTMPKIGPTEFFRIRRILAGELLALGPGGLKGLIPVAGLMPALVPGMVEAGLVALQEFGTVSFADVIAPAIELADGMPLDETRANALFAAAVFSIFGLHPGCLSAIRPDARSGRRFPSTRSRPNTARHGCR